MLDMYFKKKKWKREREREKKNTHLDHVVKAKEKWPLSLIAGYHEHIQLYQDNSSESPKSLEALIPTSINSIATPKNEATTSLDPFLVSLAALALLYCGSFTLYVPLEDISIGAEVEASCLFLLLKALTPFSQPSWPPLHPLAPTFPLLSTEEIPLEEKVPQY